MEFYAEIFNGTITNLITFGDSPVEVPKEMEERIFNAELKAEEIHLKASDDLPMHEVKVGTNISLFTVFSDNEKKLRIFEDLAKDGKILFPIDDNFGMLKDKFNIQWMFVTEE